MYPFTCVNLGVQRIAEDNEEEYIDDAFDRMDNNNNDDDDDEEVNETVNDEDDDGDVVAAGAVDMNGDDEEDEEAETVQMNGVAAARGRRLKPAGPGLGILPNQEGGTPGNATTSSAGQ